MANPQKAAHAVLGWFLLIIIVAAISRTRTGYTVVYYLLVIAIIVVILGSYQRVTELLSGVSSPWG